MESYPPHSGSSIQPAEPSKTLSERIRSLEKRLNVLVCGGVIAIIGFAVAWAGIWLGRAGTPYNRRER